jgi:hypothetical protein
MTVIVAHPAGRDVIRSRVGCEEEAWDVLSSCARPRDRPVASTAGPAPDRDLLDRLAAGDEQALIEIYDRHSPVVYGTALYLTADVDGAADVTEAVFVELWTRAQRYAASTVPLYPTLAGLAHRHAQRVVRDRQARRTAPLLGCLPCAGGLPCS